MKSKKILFPNDHKEHNSIIEWWYFNGHLKDEEGNSYSFMDCLFKANVDKVKIPYLNRGIFRKIFDSKKYIYFAHAILSDIGKQKNYKEVQNISLVSNDSFTKEKLFVNYIDPILVGGFVNDEIEEIAPDIFHIKTENLDLKLESKKQVLLEGGEGHISVCGRGSYYYSMTDLKTSGTITVDGKKINVKGKSWMDHQWADTSYKQDKWSWFSLQLNNGVDIMCCEYDDGKTKDCLVDIVDGSEKTKHFKKLILNPGEEVWKSKITKSEYPMTWGIEIPEYEAKFSVKSLMSDQEMIFMAINYWEGPLEVVGTIGGEEVKGVGFMELVGYPSDYNYLLTYGNEMRKKIIKGLGL
ncbi:MAG: lipocalin-like domain-containing protein [bacterium]